MHLSRHPVFNKQPWRFVFIHDKKTLDKMHSALSPGNE